MEDIISRQAAIKVLTKLARDNFSLQDSFKFYLEALKDAEDCIKGLPSAQPPLPCDVCRHNPPSSGDGKPCSYCPAERQETE